MIVLLVKNFSLEPYGTVFQRTVAIVIILVDTAVSDAMKKAHITRNEETRNKIGASKRGKHYIHINGKRKLVGPDYINNVEENNE